MSSEVDKINTILRLEKLLKEVRGNLRKSNQQIRDFKNMSLWKRIMYK